MKKYLLLLFCITIVYAASAQNYDNIINYSLNGTPTKGVKIKTNLPFSDGSQMPTIHIYGYNYGTQDVIDLSVVYYIYNSAFINYSASSAGNYAPSLSLSNEGGRVVLFINDRSYFQRFTVSVYAKGMSADTVLSHFQGWTVVDDTLSGTKTVNVPYKNKFNGNTYLSGGIWNSSGNVGIGTTNPTEKLSVKGNIHAQEVKVTTAAADWPDYVFRNGYRLTPLDSLSDQIKWLGHLPGMPSASTIETEGQNLGEINKKLLLKVEELTLYILQQQAQNKKLQDKTDKQAVLLEKLEQEVDILKEQAKTK